MKTGVTNAARTPYQDDFAAQAYKLCLLGITDRDLAAFFGVSQRTLQQWKKEQPEFASAVLRGNKTADMEVAASLYQQTLDRVITCKQAIKCKEIYYDDNGKRVEKERIEIVEVDKHIPADFRSQQYWLRNRNPKQWCEKYDGDEAETAKSITLNLGLGHNPEGDETAG